MYFFCSSAICFFDTAKLLGVYYTMFKHILQSCYEMLRFTLVINIFCSHYRTYVLLFH